MNKFIENYNKPVSEYVETKGTGRFQAKYLSWAFAWKMLKEQYPEASFQNIYFDGLPYLKTESGYYVKTVLFLTLDDRKNNFGFDYLFPVLDNTFKSIDKPNSFQINTSLQRCLVKNIAVNTGLGLSLYAGEDLPESEVIQESKPITKPISKPETKVTKPFPVQEIEKDFISALTFKGLEDLYNTALKLYPDDKKQVIESKDKAKKIIADRINNEALKEIKG